MKVLELFAGSRSIGNIAESRGHEVFSVDIKPFPGINLVKDIRFLDISDIPFKPDMIWASPPCTSYSIAAISTHRDGQKPKSEFAKESDRLMGMVLSCISYFDCIYYIENPRGMLRKMNFMKGLDRVTVSYCKYGDNRMKPTDIWSNNIINLFNINGWNPRPMCFNGNTNCHHESAPRGSKTGTQGLSGNYDRSIIPNQLCEEIIIATEIKLFTLK